MEDTCFLCCENLATVAFAQCDHRLCCQACFDRLAMLSGVQGGPLCPQCRRPGQPIRDATQLQLQKTALSHGQGEAEQLEQTYPSGALLCGIEVPDDADLVRTVRQKLVNARDDQEDWEKVKVELLRTLTVAQYQSVFAELLKDEDLHAVLQNIDRRRFDKIYMTRQIQRWMVKTVEDADTVAVVSRAVVGTAGSAAVCYLTQGLQKLNAFHGAANFVTFGVFAAIEIYRHSRGELSTTELSKNLGEHAAGAVAATKGAALGATVGSAVPFFGTVLGAIVGGLCGSVLADAAARYGYRKVLPKKVLEVCTEEESVARPKPFQQIAAEAAKKFYVNLDPPPVGHSFAEAHKRFRDMLYNCHPDKYPNVSAEERERLTQETQDVLACWGIVRQFYADRGDLENKDDYVHEGYIKVYVLKTYDVALGGWKVVRSWFGNLGLGRDVHQGVEKIESETIYF